MISTDENAPKFAPSTVMVVPPEVGFNAGERTCATIGELYTKFKVCDDVKPATVTTIAAKAPVPLGATQVNDVWSILTETDVHSLPPTLTEI